MSREKEDQLLPEERATYENFLETTFLTRTIVSIILDESLNEGQKLEEIETLTRGKENYISIFLYTNIIKAVCKKGYAEIFNYIFTKNPSRGDFHHKMSLDIAASNGHQELVKLLLTNYPEHLTKLDAFKAAVDNGHRNIVEIFFENNPEMINYTNEEGKTALHIAIEKNDNQLALFLIQNHPELLCTRDNKGNTALHIAIEKNNYDLFSSLIETDPAIVHIKNNLIISPIQLAVENNNVSMVESLLQHNPDLYIDTNGTRQTVLFIPIWRDNLELIKLILNHDQSLAYVADDNGWTILHSSANQRSELIAEYLITHYPDLIHVRSTGGETPLHRAAHQTYGTNNNLYSLLVKHGADQCIFDNTYKTPIDKIQFENVREFFYLLQNRFSNIDAIFIKIINNQPLSYSDNYVLETISRLENNVKEYILEFIFSKIKALPESEFPHLKKIINQYDLIKGWGVMKTFVPAKKFPSFALNIIGSFFESIDPKLSYISKELNLLIKDFREAVLKLDFVKTEEIYKAAMEYEKNIVPNSVSAADGAAEGSAVESGAEESKDGDLHPVNELLMGMDEIVAMSEQAPTEAAVASEAVAEDHATVVVDDSEADAVEAEVEDEAEVEAPVAAAGVEDEAVDDEFYSVNQFLRAMDFDDEAVEVAGSSDAYAE